MNTYNQASKVSALTNDTFNPTFVGDTSKTARDQRAMNVRILADLKVREIARAKKAKIRMQVASIIAGFVCVGILAGVVVGASHLAVAFASL